MKNSALGSSELIRQAYELTTYSAKSLYYQWCTDYCANNKLKTDFLRIVRDRQEHREPNGERIGVVLQLILRDVTSDVFLKPLVSYQEPDLAPRSVMELTNLVNREGFYLLLTQSSITIFLRNQSEYDNQRNGGTALRNLCDQLSQVPDLNIYKDRHVKYFLSNVEDFSLLEFKKPTFLDFFLITQKLISNTMVVFLKNLSLLNRDTENSISLASFKKLFLSKLLETLRYGNVARGQHDPKLLRSIFHHPTADLAMEESVKRSIQKIIEDTTGIDPTQTRHFSEIINYADPQKLINNFGFDFNLFCLQTNDIYFVANLAKQTIDCQETSAPRGSCKQFENFNDNPKPEQLALNDFLNEICLRMLASSFHDACLVIVDFEEKTKVIDFQQIMNSQLSSLDKHCSLQSLYIGLSTKSFLELLFEVFSRDEVMVFLSSGCVEWKKLRAMLIKLIAMSGFQFEKILVCEDGLVKDNPTADGPPNTTIYRLQDTARVELIPQGHLKLQSYDSQTTLLISIESGKWRRVAFDEFVVDDTSNTTNIDNDFVIHDLTSASSRSAQDNE